MPSRSWRANWPASTSRDFFTRYVFGTEDLPLTRLLDEFGVSFHLRAATGPKDRGGKPASGDAPRNSLGARVAPDLKLTHVFRGGPAGRAGLSAGDTLVAIDGVKATPDMLAALLRTSAQRQAARRPRIPARRAADLRCRTRRSARRHGLPVADRRSIGRREIAPRRMAGIRRMTQAARHAIAFGACVGGCGTADGCAWRAGRLGVRSRAARYIGRSDHGVVLRPRAQRSVPLAGRHGGARGRRVVSRTERLHAPHPRRIAGTRRVACAPGGIERLRSACTRSADGRRRARLFEARARTTRPTSSTFAKASADRNGSSSIRRSTTRRARPRRSSTTASRPTAGGWRSAWPSAATKTPRCMSSTSPRASPSARPFPARAAPIRRGGTTAKCCSTRSYANARQASRRPDSFATAARSCGRSRPRWHPSTSPSSDAASIRRWRSIPTIRRRSTFRRCRPTSSAWSAMASRTSSRCTSRH